MCFYYIKNAAIPSSDIRNLEMLVFFGLHIQYFRMPLVTLLHTALKTLASLFK